MLNEYNVVLDAILLKPNMVLPGRLFCIRGALCECYLNLAHAKLIEHVLMCCLTHAHRWRCQKGGTLDSAAMCLLVLISLSSGGYELQHKMRPAHVLHHTTTLNAFCS